MSGSLLSAAIITKVFLELKLSLREQRNNGLWGITYRADVGDNLYFDSKKNQWEK